MDNSPTLSVFLSPMERGIILHWLDQLYERIDVLLYFYDGVAWRDIEDAEIGTWRDFIDDLMYRLIGEGGDMPTQLAEEIRGLGGMDISDQCCGDKSPSIDRPLELENDWLEVRDIRCLRITHFVNILIGIVEKIVLMHTNIMAGTRDSIAILALVGGIVSLAAVLLTGGTIVVPAIALGAALYMLTFQYGMSHVALKTLWEGTHNYLVVNKCELINILWVSESGDRAKEALLDFFENVWQSQSLATAVQSAVVRRFLAIALPNKIFNNLFNFASDMTLANVSCECAICFPDNQAANFTPVYQMDIANIGELIAPIAQWQGNVVFEAQAIGNEYRLDICNPTTDEGNHIVEFNDLEFDIRAIYDGTIITAGLTGDPIAMDFEADVLEDYGADWTPIDLYCLTRQSWRCRIASITSKNKFRIKLTYG